MAKKNLQHKPFVANQRQKRQTNKINQGSSQKAKMNYAWNCMVAQLLAPWQYSAGIDPLGRFPHCHNPRPSKDLLCNIDWLTLLSQLFTTLSLHCVFMDRCFSQKWPPVCQHLFALSVPWSFWQFHSLVKLDWSILQRWTSNVVQ